MPCYEVIAGSYMILMVKKDVLRKRYTTIPTVFIKEFHTEPFIFHSLIVTNVICKIRLTLKLKALRKNENFKVM